MKMGFTGTRHGMTDAQRIAFAGLIDLLRPFEFHHGDCVGADDDAANAVDALRSTGNLSCRIVVHPPLSNGLRALNPHFDEMREPRTHFARNRNIVADTDVLVACPCYADPITPKTMGGTAYTVNYARKHRRTIYVINPTGSVEREN